MARRGMRMDRKERGRGVRGHETGLPPPANSRPGAYGGHTLRLPDVPSPSHGGVPFSTTQAPFEASSTESVSPVSKRHWMTLVM